VYVKKWAAEYVREQLGVPDCRSLIRLDKEVRRRGEEPKRETHYYMSSLDPDAVSASEFQEYILRHWEIENCLHLHKDKEYREDKHACRSSWGKSWTLLTNMAVSLIRLLRNGERTLREVHERCAAEPLAIGRTLGLHHCKKTC